MLRWNQTRRFALQNSPTREQREVMFAEEDANKILIPRSGEQSDRKKIAEIRNITHRNIDNIVPPDIPETDAQKLFRAIELYGSKELIEKIKREKTAEDKLRVLIEDPETALSIALMTNAKRMEFEELVGMIEKRLKTLFREIDQGKNRKVSSKLLLEIEKFIKKMKAEGISGGEEIERMMQGIESEDATNLDGLNVTSIQTTLNDVLEIVRGKNVLNAAKMGDERGEGTQASEYSKTTTVHLEEMQNADRFVQNEQTALIVVTRAIQKKKNQLWEIYRDQWNEATALEDEELFERYGVTLEGFQEAFLKQTHAIREAFPDKESGETPSDDSHYPRGSLDETSKLLLRAREVLETLKTIENQSGSGKLKDAPWLTIQRLEEEAKEQLASDIVAVATRARSRLEEHPIRNTEPGYKNLQLIYNIIHKLGGADQIGLSVDPTFRIWIRTTPKRELERILRSMQAIESNPELVQGTEKIAIHAQAENIQKNRDIILKEATESVTSINNCRNNICDVIGMHGQLQRRRAIIENNLKIASDPTNPNADKSWKDAQVDVAALKNAATLIAQVQNKDNVHIIDATTYTSKGYKSGTRATYDPKGQTIFVNRDECSNDDDTIKRVIEHEQAHQIIDIVSRQTKLWPCLLMGMGSALRNQAKGTGWTESDYGQKSRVLAEKWKCQTEKDGWEERFTEELLVRYADWQAGRRSSVSTEENEFYTMVSSIGETDDQNNKVEMYSITEDGIPGLTDDSEQGVALERDYTRDVFQIGKDIKEIDAFFKTWKSASSQESDQVLKDLQDAHRMLSEKIKNGEDLSSDEKVLDVCLKAGEDMRKAIREFDEKQHAFTATSPSEKRGWRKIVSSIHWMSISDVMTMFTEASEDIQRMWKRRGEGVRATVGKKIFGSIPQAVPYLGRIESEFAGREQSSEQEEVGVWEKRYETVDSRTMLYDILPHSRNKDEIKAIINLLTKRGRLDWNFEGLWNALESVSDYHIPHEKCIRDPLLRDTYLQMLCANIWGDKGQFNGWKNANDSGIESGKNQYQGTIDTLSGTSNGLASQAKILLEKQIQVNSGQALAAHDELDPHLYEGIIHYAMRNGKMAMEDKIFYLIQGVAHGLITIDRLKAMYGDQGGVLNSFPVIDFFNGKTYTDIMRLATEIGYPTATSYDYRTTHLLMEEFRNDVGTRDRTQKGLREPQKWDHEDMPMFISMMDHNAIDALIAPVSGSTSKISKPGMKNIYVGYHTVMQYFAIRAKMARDHGRQFSDQDAAQCATLLAAYANFDNRVSIPGKLSERPTLSANDMNDKPVSGSQKTREYRSRMVEFVHRIGGEFSINSAGTMPLDKYVREKFEDGESVKYEDCNKSSPVFDRQLKDAFKGNKQKLIEILASYADRGPDQGGFIPEQDKYTYDNVKNITQ